MNHDSELADQIRQVSDTALMVADCRDARRRRRIQAACVFSDVIRDYVGSSIQHDVDHRPVVLTDLIVVFCKHD